MPRDDRRAGCAAPSWRFAEHAGRLRAGALYGLDGFARARRRWRTGAGSLFLRAGRVGPSIVPYPGRRAGAMNLDQRLQPPSAAHWFGTDEMGNDIYTRVVVGARTVARSASCIVGVARRDRRAARHRGRLCRRPARRADHAGDRRVPVGAGPGAGARRSSALGPGHPQRGVALSLVWWPGYVRLVEAKALRCARSRMSRPARAVGAGARADLSRHILPNCVSPIIVKASMDMGPAILAAASLGFIGLGAQPPPPEWGAMIPRAQLPADVVVVLRVSPAC